jgi:hypothetical protein
LEELEKRRPENNSKSAREKADIQDKKLNSFSELYSKIIVLRLKISSIIP